MDSMGYFWVLKKYLINARRNQAKIDPSTHSLSASWLLEIVTIGSAQLAHSKVGVGVTQANLGHGRPNFSPMDGLLGLSIPYLDQIELAFLIKTRT